MTHDSLLAQSGCRQSTLCSHNMWPGRFVLNLSCVQTPYRHQVQSWKSCAITDLTSPSMTSPLEWKMVGLCTISMSPGCSFLEMWNSGLSASLATALPNQTANDLSLSTFSSQHCIIMFKSTSTGIVQSSQELPAPDKAASYVNSL